MKTKWFIILVIALSLGCTREIETNVTYINGEFTLYASSGENETKTVLQRDGSVFWSPGDCITVFYGNIPGKFTSTNTEPAASAEFTGSLGSIVLDGETEFKAIYPHSDDIVIPGDDSILSIYLPSEQTAVEGTFADDLFICVAKSKDVNLHFFNVCGGVKFSLTRNDIKKVVFKGNNKETLAGRMAVEFNSDGVPFVSDFTAGKTSVSLTVPDGGTFKEGSWYYLVLAPQALTKGYTMELWTDQLVETVSAESSVTIRRSAWGVLKNLGTISPIIEIPKAIDLGLPSGLKWASFNLGATKAEEYGDYYAWGEIEPYYSSLNPLTWKDGKEAGYDWVSYKWCNGTDETLTKYCFDSSYGFNGFTDSKTILDAEDDAATVNLGDDWRMPTDAEMTELRESCTWNWTTRGGINGYDVTGPNGNFIFLPTAGACDYDTGVSTEGDRGFYWTSSLHSNSTIHSFGITFWNSGVGRNGYVRIIGMTIRPVLREPTYPVASVSLDKTELELIIGETTTLSATVLPNNATNKTVSWSSSNESVATVSSEGLVTGVAAGSAIITVTTSDGGKTATCNVTVKESSSPSVAIPEIVDLGLSVKWASFNLGATKPEEFGDYYAWGEIEPYYSSLDPLTWKDGKDAGYDWQSYTWCIYDAFLDPLTKYCTNPDYGYEGFTDGKSVLDAEDDAAHVHLGSKWRIPTIEELEELRTNCTWEKTTLNGIGVRKVTGPNGNFIYLPVAGWWNGKSLSSANSMGSYWSSSVDTKDPANSYDIIIMTTVVSKSSNTRTLGYSIRPVYAE